MAIGNVYIISAIAIVGGGLFGSVLAAQDTEHGTDSLSVSISLPCPPSLERHNTNAILIKVPFLPARTNVLVPGPTFVRLSHSSYPKCWQYLGS